MSFELTGRAWLEDGTTMTYTEPGGWTPDPLRPPETDEEPWPLRPAPRTNNLERPLALSLIAALALVIVLRRIAK